MKLSCDVCRSALQMNAGGQNATCTCCGMRYSLEVLREKLNRSTPTQQSRAATQTPASAQAAAPVSAERSTPTAPDARQFVMPVEKLFAACLTGYVQDGCIGVGERVYINGDYSTPYRVYRFDDDADKTHVSAGQYARMFVYPNNREVMKQARIVTSDPIPTPNAYRYPGSVEGYFADLLQREFPDYTLQRQVEWPGLKIPVTFLLLKDGRPALGIFVVDSGDSRGRYQAQKGEKLLRNAFICGTHFFKDYRNDAPYVIDRIRAALG